MKFKTITFVLLSILSNFSIKAQPIKNYFFKTTANFAKVSLNNDLGELPFNEIPNPFEFGIPKRTFLKFLLPEDSLSVKMTDNINIDIYRIDKKDTLKIKFISVEVAKFDNDFKKRNKGKVNVSIPEVYELLNILISLTQTGIKDKDLVYQESAYYAKVQSYFEKFKSHPAVLSIDSLLKRGRYFPIKMDSYSFEFDKNSKIIGSKNYGVINWENINSITPDLIEKLNDFVQISNFRNFYSQNKPFYDSQVDFYKKEINLNRMIKWLKVNFPTKTYDYFNIIFSPLVYGNQSTQNFQDNNFTEAQAHVNFPYIDKKKQIEMPKSYNLYRGNIVFTELNHNFINPEADKYDKEIKTTLTDLTIWEENGKAAQFGYPSPMACFNEYMNWALVSLYLYDYADRSEFDKITSNIDTSMQDYRGFKKFKAFNHFLIDKYKNRSSKATVADLYPEIVQWFKDNNL